MLELCVCSVSVCLCAQRFCVSERSRGRATDRHSRRLGGGRRRRCEGTAPLLPPFFMFARLFPSRMSHRPSVCLSVQELQRRGAVAVIITLGARGAFVRTASGEFSPRPVQLTLQVRLEYKTQRRDSLLCLVLVLSLLFSFVGAGDAFIGAFAVFFAGGVSLRESVRRANAWRGGPRSNTAHSRATRHSELDPALLCYSAAR